uniref:Clathrin adaptor alpha/beta/gamma-adaptin appendage Ig-like subdomain domain-containing protein n=1 Tax=Romanomermis culicivorax TaxID=13658 RepID=A0A915JLZ3_ROMCU
MLNVKLEHFYDDEDDNDETLKHAELYNKCTGDYAYLNDNLILYGTATAAVTNQTAKRKSDLKYDWLHVTCTEILLVSAAVGPWPCREGLNTSLGSGTADLLGLGSPTGLNSTNNFTNGGGASSALTDIFAAPPSVAASNGNNGELTMSISNGHVTTGGPSDVIKGKEDDVKKFICKQNGVLYEDPILQVGVKMESRQNLARLGMFYGNKSSLPLTGFTPDVAAVGTALNMQVKPVDPIVEAGAQVQQLINVECVADFYVNPTIRLHFVLSNVSKTIVLQLPLFLNKFLEPAEMNGEQFFQRWKQLNQSGQECQKVFTFKTAIEPNPICSKLSSFGLLVLQNVDPNAQNFVAAGIVHTREASKEINSRHIFAQNLSGIKQAEEQLINSSKQYFFDRLAFTEIFYPISRITKEKDQFLYTERMIKNGTFCTGFLYGTE